MLLFSFLIIIVAAHTASGLRGSAGNKILQGERVGLTGKAVSCSRRSYDEMLLKCAHLNSFALNVA